MAGQDASINQELPGLCGCNHDDAYHTRPVFGMAEDKTMVMIGNRGCNNCLCNRYDPSAKPQIGTGANAPKLWPGGGRGD